MWTILAFIGGFSTCLTIFVVGIVIGGGHKSSHYLTAPEVEEPDDSTEVSRQVEYSEHVRVMH